MAFFKEKRAKEPEKTAEQMMDETIQEYKNDKNDINLISIAATYKEHLNISAKSADGGYITPYEFETKGGKYEIKLDDMPLMSVDIKSTSPIASAAQKYEPSPRQNFNKKEEVRTNIINFLDEHKLALATIALSGINCEGYNLENFKELVDTAERLIENNLGINIKVAEKSDMQAAYNLMYAQEEKTASIARMVMPASSMDLKDKQVDDDLDR